MNTEYIVQWINEFLEESNLKDYYLHDVKVSVHTGEGGIWIAEITQGGAVLIEPCGEYIMRGCGDTINEALADLNSISEYMLEAQKETV